MQSKTVCVPLRQPSILKGRWINDDSLCVNCFMLSLFCKVFSYHLTWTDPKMNPNEDNFAAIKIYFHQHQLNDCPENSNAHVDGTVKTCHQILHPVSWLKLSDNALIGEEVENHSNKAKGFSGELIGGQSIDECCRQGPILIRGGGTGQSAMMSQGHTVSG